MFEVRGNRFFYENNGDLTQPATGTDIAWKIKWNMTPLRTSISTMTTSRIRCFYLIAMCHRHRPGNSGNVLRSRSTGNRIIIRQQHDNLLITRRNAHHVRNAHDMGTHLDGTLFHFSTITSYSPASTCTPFYTLLNTIAFSTVNFFTGNYAVRWRGRTRDGGIIKRRRPAKAKGLSPDNV